MKKIIPLLLLRIDVSKPDFSKRSIHGLEKLFGGSISTWFVFSCDLRQFVAWHINFSSLSGTKNHELHVWMVYVNTSSCTWITSSLLSIIPLFIMSSTSSVFIISTTLFLIKSNSSVRDCSETWQSFPSKWICDKFPTLDWYY